MLREEREFFDRNRNEWLMRYPDRFVLVKGQDLIGVFSSISEALSEGTRRYGLDSYLVRQVRPLEEEIFISAFTLGFPSASPSSYK
jgi:hypothetical protein